MRRFLTGRAWAPAVFLAAGFLVAAAGDVGGQPAKDKDKPKEKGPKGADDKAAKDLRKAFDAITDVSQATPGGKDGGRLLDHAGAFYRAGVRAWPDDPRRAGELAVAAGDAARGLGHLRRAGLPPVADLPEPPAGFAGKDGPKDDGPGGKDAKDGPKGKAPPPPPLKDDPRAGGQGPKGKEPPPIPAAERAGGPWADARDALTRARDRIAGTGEASDRGPGRDFLDAAKRAYARGREAYEGGEYRRAAELARAAEAWSHVPEHLARAGWDGSAAPPPAPEPKAKAPGVPPPPPPLKD